MEIGFRVDASALIGGGHAIRCLTLANALARHGAGCTFVFGQVPEGLASHIAEAGHQVERIEPHAAAAGAGWEKAILGGDRQRADAEATLRALGGGSDWIVVDHYLLDATWESAARDGTRHILAIDDLANRPHDCDALLDQTFGRDVDDYAARVPESARRLVGAEYALLRPEFAERRARAVARRRHSGQPQRLLVSLGTGDLGGVTGRMLELVLPAAAALAIDVVLGAEAPSLPRVRALAECHDNIRLVVDARNMAELMADADIAIGAAGATSWERCCLGLPSLVVVLAENQRLIGETLERAGAHRLIKIEDNDVATGLQALLEDGEARARMTQAALDVTDGRGTERVCAALLEHSFAAEAGDR